MSRDAVNVKKFTLSDPERIRSAFILPATPRDLYCLKGEWQIARELNLSATGVAVEGIRTALSHLLPGDEVEICDVFSRVVLRCRVLGIRLIDIANLRQQDAAMLGYRDRAEWLEDNRGGPGGTRGWFVTVDVIEHTGQEDLPKQTEKH